ncbi:hypothetical protein ERO13_D11G066550v2 [Gossypium hirsutum]|nr:hypothetical protein ERO13_D11G066550v2 [Gossypium hirsutum]
MKIPWRREEIERVTSRTAKLRTDASGEIANQQMHIPWVLPKFPGRFYYYFGKPILTEEMKVELREKKKCDEMYLHIKSEVEGCIDFLKNKEKRILIEIYYLGCCTKPLILVLPLPFIFHLLCMI